MNCPKCGRKLSGLQCACKYLVNRDHVILVGESPEDWLHSLESYIISFSELAVVPAPVTDPVRDQKNRDTDQKDRAAAQTVSPSVSQPSGDILDLDARQLAERMIGSYTREGNGADYYFDRLHPEKGAELTRQGIKKVEKFTGIEDLNDPDPLVAAIKKSIIASINKKETDKIKLEPMLNPPSMPKTLNEKKPSLQDHEKAEAVTVTRLVDSTGIGAASFKRQSTADVRRVDKVLSEQIKQVSLFLIFNLVAAVLMIVNLWLNKCQIPFSLWNCIVTWLPFVSAVIDKFISATVREGAGWIKNKIADTMLGWLLIGSLFLVFCVLTCFGEGDTWAMPIEIALIVCSFLFLAVTTIRCIKFLENNNFNDRYVIAIRTASIILYSALAISVLFMIWNHYRSLKVGNTVTLGSYEQDGDLSNGTEEISWTVLSIDDGKALLVSNVCIYAMPYNSDSSDNSWTNSDLRKWLNGEFYQTAFSSAEQGVICEGEITTRRLSNEEGHTYGETYGEAEVTVDKVFVPDLSEFYILTSELNVSPVAKEVFSANNTTYGGENYQSMFWTRSPYGEQQNWANGYIVEREQAMSYINPPTMYAMVKPAIYIDVDLYSNMSKANQIQTAPDTDRSDYATSSDTSKIDPHYYCYDDLSYNDLLNFGPGLWVDPNETVDFNCFVYQAFCERLETDPAMAAAVLAYADKQLGTRYSGRFYSEIEDDWIAGINDAAKTFVNDTGLWVSETTAFEELLEKTADIRIIDAGGEEIEILNMQAGSEQPIICGPERIGTTAPFKYLCFTITVKDTKITLLFLIDLGFTPVI